MDKLGTWLAVTGVAIGFVVLAIVGYQIRGPARRSQNLIETGATYWHTVDFLWVLIFALLLWLDLAQMILPFAGGFLLGWLVFGLLFLRLKLQNRTLSRTMRRQSRELELARSPAKE